ncbi:hypothetical protein J3R82DRAFT_7500 [Butyriboletus roseoflavus]|nr:hypothetical protein J3R82DRAFT_7500 [Butyriboletus roseoflavus]
MAQGWVQLTDSQRASYLQEYNAAGISLIVSAFGSTDTPTTSGMNYLTTANDLAAWVVQYSLQGVDVDYEVQIPLMAADFAAFDYGGGSAEAWLIGFTKQLRTLLPQGQYIISHAPVAPWFNPTLWAGGGYLAVDKSVGSLIDWVKGVSEYTTCSGLLTASTSQWPETALFQIAANGPSLDKLVIGKPGTTSDAGSGYMSASTLASCVAQAHSSGWDGGVMVWQYPNVGSSWIVAVRGSTWPVSGSPPPTPTTSALQPTTSSSPPTTTAPSGSGSCAGVSAWASNVVVSTTPQLHPKSRRSHSSRPV